MKQNKKQTAVEYLIEMIEYSSKTTSQILEETEVYKKAKEMNKQQIINSHEAAYIDMNLSFRASDRAEQYYKETYGTK